MSRNKQIANKYRDNKKGNVKGKTRSSKFAKSQDESKVVRDSDVVNDVSYYVNANDATLSAQLMNFSFDDFAGIPTDMGSVSGTPHNAQIPTVAQIVVNPAAGFTRQEDGMASGINLVALKTYTYLSATNAKTTQYGPQDVMLLILAVGDILAQFSHGARALGLMHTYNQRNRAYPELIVQAAGFDIDDLKMHAAEYKTRYNYIITRFNKIPIPQDIKYFKKMSEIFHGVYLDEEGSGMAQSYVLVPYSHWVLDETTNPNGSILKTTIQKGCQQGAATDNLYVQNTFANYLDDLDTMIDALLTSSTFNYIYADIRRLHEKENLALLTLNAIPDNYVVLPSKVEELSMWINNLLVLGLPEVSPVSTATGITFTPNNDVETDTNTNMVVYRPQFRAEMDETDFETLVNFKHDNPTFDEKVYSVMLHNKKRTFQASGETFYRSYSVSLCDWYVVQFNVASYHGGESLQYPKSLLYSSSFTGAMCANLMAFDWHPMFYKVSSGNKVYIFGDTQYYTNINYQTLFRIHEVMFMEEISLV